MKKKLFKFLSVLVFASVILLGVNAFAASDGTLTIDTVNGVPPTGICVAGPITIVAHGVTGGQGGSWHLSISWGDGVTSTDASGITITSGTLGGKEKAYAFSSSHTPVGPITSPLTVILYHSQPSGEDGQVVIVNQCVAPPTQGVVNVVKHVINDNGGTTLAPGFTLHIASNTFVGSETANTSNSFKLNPGTYTVTEDAKAGYTNTGIVCIGDNGTNTTNGQVTVVVGKNFTCTVTNNDNIKTSPTLSITNSPVTYNGSAQAAVVVGSTTGTVTNVKYDGSSTVPTNVGTYAVTADFAPTDTALFNSLTGASAGNFVINKANTTTTVTCSNVTYTGVAQTPCSVTVTGNGMATLTPVPTYSNNVNAGTASASYTFGGNPNYNGSSNSGNFTISKATATCSSSIIGYSGVYDGNAHGASGSCTGVGNVVLGGLDLGSTFTNVPGGTADWTFTDSTGNYNNTSGSVNIDISKRDIEVTANNTGKNFGASDPTLTYTITNGSKVAGDDFSGSIVRAPGEDAGSYPITQGDLSLGSNYNLTFVNGNFTISANTITVTVDHKTKVYGAADPELTYSFSPMLQDGDNFSGSLTRSSGEDVGVYGITQGTLTLSSNYNLSFNGNTLDITPAPITITADAKTKVYGTSDPALTYQVTSGSLVGTDTLSGSLARSAGENVGTHAINQGTVANSNYNITYTADNLTITKADLTVTPDNYSKVEGTIFTAFTGNVVGLVTGDDITVTYSSTGAPAPALAGTYEITANVDLGSKASNYNVTLNTGTLTVTAKNSDLSVTKTVNNSTPNVGEDITYTIVVTNAGPDDATSVVVTDLLPAGLTYVSDDSSGAYNSDTGIWTVGTLSEENGSATLNIVAKVVTGGQSIINIATAQSDNGDSNDDNNTGTVSITPTATFTLTLTKSGNGNGTVSDGTNILCDLNQCDPSKEQAPFVQSYPEGTVITLVPTPDSTSNFDGTWSGACSGTAPCTLTLTSNMSANAHFGLNRTTPPPSGGGGSGGRTICADFKDNDGDGLSDANDPGCHTDGNAGNPASYVASLNSENNGNGQVLGAETSCGIYVDKFLRKGYKNDSTAVTKVQKFLNDYNKAGLKEDGKYGSLTESWVKKFQSAHKDKILDPWKLKAPTGIFYLTTQTEVNNIMCPELKLPIPTLLPIETNPLAPQKA